MASIIDEGNGRKRIAWYSDAGRKQVRLGKASTADATIIKLHIERILEARGHNTSLRAETVAWLDGISDQLHTRIASTGLIEPRQPKKPEPEKTAAGTIGAFVDQYIGIRTDVKGNTVKTWRQTRALLIEHFTVEAEGKLPADKRLGRQIDTITALDAKGFHAWLASVTREGTPLRRFSAASVTKYTSFARQFFAAAVDDRLIHSNPFAGIKLGKKTNRARQQFVDRETIQRVFDGCADPQFKLVIALSRYGGLRIPSELDGLQWPHIDRERGRILVTSPKTERYEGGASREIPLFPELVPHIDAWYEACPPGCANVIVSNRDTEAAWRTRLMKLLTKLGIPVWPRIFHNLRASRQTELEERFPSHVVCGWMGNSESVAKAHYLTTTDSHFEQALNIQTGELKAARQPPEMGPNRTKAKNQNAKNPRNIAISRVYPGADGNRTHLAPLQTPHRV